MNRNDSDKILAQQNNSNTMKLDLLISSEICRFFTTHQLVKSLLDFE